MRHLVFCLLFGLLGHFALMAGSISGQVDLVSPQTKRSSPRYGGADSSLLGPPAPFVGVVYLTKETAMDWSPPKEPYTLVQKGLQFYPSILPIERGASVQFPNQDDTYHNVFSYSPEKRFDLGRYAKDSEPPVVKFEEAGQVRVFCEVHEHMRAVILVLDSPYFVATDDDGNYSLEGIPAGEYVLNIWRVNKPLETKVITVGDEPLVIQ